MSPMIKQLQAMVFLVELVNHYKMYDRVLKGDDKLLQPIFDDLFGLEFVEINNNTNVCVPTEKGKAAVKIFLERKQDYEKCFSVFSAVDLQSGEFAWEIVDTGVLENAEKFFNQERWSDLRIAMAEFKEMNTLEVAFFVLFEQNKERFFPIKENWQKTFMDSKTWEEVVHYHDSSLKIKDLDFEDWDGKVPGSEIIGYVGQHGARINIAANTKSPGPIYDFMETYEVVVADKMSKNVVENYLKNSYVAPCWLTDLRSGEVHTKPLAVYWELLRSK